MGAEWHEGLPMKIITMMMMMMTMLQTIVMMMMMLAKNQSYLHEDLCSSLRFKFKGKLNAFNLLGNCFNLQHYHFDGFMDQGKSSERNSKKILLRKYHYILISNPNLTRYCYENLSIII